MNAASQDMEQLHRQRAALAQRVRLPWWYLALSAVMVAAVMAVPFLSEVIAPAVRPWVSLVPVLVMFVVNRLLGRSTGVKLPYKLARAYPSVRPIGYATAGIALVACLAEYLLIGSGHTVFAVGVVVVAAAATVAVLVWRTAAIREDISEGRATAR